MRILFGFAGGRGHAEPLVPLARAAAAAGFEVAFSGRASVVPEIRRRGFAVFADPRGPADEPRPITPLLELDLAREDADLRNGFAGWIARGRAERVLELVARWSPDVVVCDETDFGGLIAAERTGLPYASVTVLAAGSFLRPRGRRGAARRAARRARASARPGRARAGAPPVTLASDPRHVGVPRGGGGPLELFGVALARVDCSSRGCGSERCRRSARPGSCRTFALTHIANVWRVEGGRAAHASARGDAIAARAIVRAGAASGSRGPA